MEKQPRSILNQQYKINATGSKLKKIGFRYSTEEDSYVYRFPVYKHKNIPVNFCKIGINSDTNKIWFNVYDSNGELYYPYYNREYGDNNIVDEIDKRIRLEFTMLGIEKGN